MKIEVINLGQGSATKKDTYGLVLSIIGLPDDNITKMLVNDFVERCSVHGMDSDQIKRFLAPISTKFRTCHRDLSDITKFYQKLGKS